jgi:hypothetical protein
MSLAASNSRAGFYRRLGFETAIDGLLFVFDPDDRGSSHTKQLEEYT